jgi:2-methylcitrate dehydratase PrpD
MCLAQVLEKFIAKLSLDQMPAEAMRMSHLGFIDSIGTMIAWSERIRLIGK